MKYERIKISLQEVKNEIDRFKYKHNLISVSKIEKPKFIFSIKKDFYKNASENLFFSDSEDDIRTIIDEHGWGIELNEVVPVFKDEDDEELKKMLLSEINNGGVIKDVYILNTEKTLKKLKYLLESINFCEYGVTRLAMPVYELNESNGDLITINSLFHFRRRDIMSRKMLRLQSTLKINDPELYKKIKTDIEENPDKYYVYYGAEFVSDTEIVFDYNLGTVYTDALEGRIANILGDVNPEVYSFETKTKVDTIELWPVDVNGYWWERED